MRKAIRAAWMSALIVIACTAYAAEAHHAYHLWGARFPYSSGEWHAVEGLGGRRLVLYPRRAKGAIGRIVITEGADVASLPRDYPTAKVIGMREERAGAHSVRAATFSYIEKSVPMKGAAFDLSLGGSRYRIDCFADARSFAHAYFSCRDMIASAAYDASPDEEVVEKALRILLMSMHTCAGTAKRIRRAAEDAGAARTRQRLRVIADVMDEKPSARGGARKLVERWGEGVDYLVLSLAHRDEPAVANRIAQKAFAADPRGITAYWLGSTEWQLGYKGIAREHVMRANLEWRTELPLAQLVRMEHEEGDIDAARRWWKRMDSSSVMKSAIVIKLARFDGASADAVDAYDASELLLCGELGAEAAVNAGVASSALGSNERAVRLFKQAIAWDPGYAPAYKALANIEMREGGDVRALMTLLATYAQRSSDPDEREQVRHIIEGMSQQVERAD